MENTYIWLAALGVTTLISIIGWLLRGMLKKIWTTLEQRLEKLEDWRHCMSEQGGPLMKDEHPDICERVSAKIASTLGQKFSDELRHERELFQKDLKLIQLTLERDVLVELRALKQANNRK